MENTDFSCPVVTINAVQPVQNSTGLEMTEVFGTPVVFRKGQLTPGSTAVYIPIDAIVPMDQPQFQGLGIKTDKPLYRVKAVRLRGQYSEGLLVPFEGGEVGMDMAPQWGITKFEQPERPAGMFGTVVAQQAPNVPWAPRYNVEPLVKNRHAIPEGTEVVVTEKLHGCNSRFTFGPSKEGDRLHVGSHNTWRKPIYGGNAFVHFVRKAKNFLSKFGFKFEPEHPINDDVWWEIAKKYDLAKKLAEHPQIVIYGEVYGRVQDLKYGLANSVEFRVFDVYDGETKVWWCHADTELFAEKLGLQTVPVLYKGPYNKATVDLLRSGKSTIDDKTIREGFVIRPAIPLNPRDKSAYKLVSEEYKLRKGDTTEFH